MASAPSASWNSRCITHLANCPNRSLPTNSSDESKKHAKLNRAKSEKLHHLGKIFWLEGLPVHCDIPIFEVCESHFQRRGHPPDVPFLQGQFGNFSQGRANVSPERRRFNVVQIGLHFRCAHQLFCPVFHLEVFEFNYFEVLVAHGLPPCVLPTAELNASGSRIPVYSGFFGTNTRSAIA